MPGFGSLIPGFNPMQPPAMQNTGLGAMGSKILQQGLAQSRAATPSAASGLGGIAGMGGMGGMGGFAGMGGMGGIASLPPMGLLGMLLGRKPQQAAAPLDLTPPVVPPAQPVVPPMPVGPTGLY